MEIYLIRHGQIDRRHAVDPYSVPLSEEGHAQAARIAAQCETWDIGLLCSSSMRRAAETADAISDRLPLTERWDLDELEDLTLDDLLGEPTAGPLVSSWTPAQLQTAYRQAYSRISGALTRIQLYAAANRLEAVAIVGHHSTISLLLLNWLGHDWRAMEQVDFRLDFCGSSKVTLDGSGKAHIDWINRAP
ncbi:MAG: histidine phosphatase family protein [Anaerolineae bacterium]|nr:histidine phosphatase family protein [Anaerolineae bacterium]